MATPRLRLALVLAVALAGTLGVYARPPIAQPAEYHAFADQRPLLGVPHLLNVLSNLAFILVGVLGLVRLRPGRAAPILRLVCAWDLVPYRRFFLGLVLTGLGSAWYHLAPDSARLTWDRLPMALAFMSLLASVLGERLAPRLEPWLLGILVCLGVASIGFWRWSIVAGTEDLRPYVLVQYLPAIIIPLVVLLFPGRYTRGGDLFGVIGLYAVAKVLEALDAALFSLGSLVSGHTLKHLVAAGAAYWLLRMVVRREPMAAGRPE